jgi:hypothetical protein
MDSGIATQLCFADDDEVGRRDCSTVVVEVVVVVEWENAAVIGAHI